MLLEAAASVFWRELLGGVFPRHLHVPAQGNHCHLVFGLTPLKAHQPGTKADAELEDLDPEELGHQEVAQFMDEDQPPHEENGASYLEQKRSHAGGAMLTPHREGDNSEHPEGSG